MDAIQDKCDRITDILNKRETERKLDIEKKREDKNLCFAENEKLDHLERTFFEKQLEIENAIKNSEDIDVSKLSEHFNLISKNILNLQKYVAASNIFLRSYDIKKSHQNIQDLTNRARELEDRLLPKKKFGFKKKTKATPREEHSNGSSDQVDSSRKHITLDLTVNFCGFENVSNKRLLLENEDICKKDVTLRNLSECTVTLTGNPSTLHMSHLRNCVVLTGPVSTSIFADDCSDCKFVIACQQLRLHSSFHIDIYLHVTSRAIIEDSTNIAVAPYNFSYEGIEGHFSHAGLDLSTNHWSTIDDFNWLNKKQSPNWAVLKDGCKVLDWSSYSINTG